MTNENAQNIISIVYVSWISAAIQIHYFIHTPTLLSIKYELELVGMLAFEIIISVWVSVSKKTMDINFQWYAIIIEW